MYIDTHAHIYIEKFDEDFDEMIQRAKDAKIDKVLMPNIDVSSMETVMRRHQEDPTYCLPMVGLHPCSVGEQWKEDLDQLSHYLSMEGIIAVGEIGIDLYWDKTFEAEQRAAFATQIQWALEHDLPIVIHSRSAIDISIDIVGQHQDGRLRGVFHCFDQNIEAAKQIMDLGFYMGIGGVSTYKKNTALRETIKNIPLSSIILETDAPFLPPVPYRGKRNEPSYIPHIAEVLSDVQEVSVAEIASVTTENAIELFRLA